MNHRLLGTIGMLGAPMLLAEGVLRNLGRGNGDPLIAITEVLYIGGWICSAIGMRMMRATGDTRLGGILSAVQLAGLCMALAFSIIEPFASAAMQESALYHALDIAWPFSHLFMIVIGIATIAAGVWRDSRKYVPLFCGLALPCTLLLGKALALPEEMGLFLFGAWAAIGFSQLGRALRNDGPGASRAPSRITT